MGDKGNKGYSHIMIQQPITDYHAKYFAHLLTRRGGSGMERLSQSLFDASVDLNPHQIEAAAFALANPVSEGVLLADEVGLGKTIEAGLVLCQYWAEGRRTLMVVCPASLRKQWAIELEEKFHLPTRVLETGIYNQLRKDGVDDPFAFSGVVIVSYYFIIKHEETVVSFPWDLIVIDEAHKLRNAYRKSNKIGRSIRDIMRGRRKILLTATPLQNTIMELYGLTTFIDEYAFGDPVHFRAMYSRPNGEILKELKERIAPYYTRTLRQNVLEYIQYTERRAITKPFFPADEEQRLYDELNEYLQREDTYAFPSRHRHLSVLIVRKVLASSSAALVGTLEMLENRLENLLTEAKKENADLFEEFLSSQGVDEDLLDEILEDIDEYEDGAAEEENSEDEGPPQIDSEKLQEEINLVKKFIIWARSIQVDEKSRALITALRTGFSELEKMNAPQKAVIFTESRRTQNYLKTFLEANGYAGKIVTFNGSNTDTDSRATYERYKELHREDGTLSGSKTVDIRTAIIERFKNEAEIMIATEAAAEGVNLQFCSLVVNYDLPWNPQRIEQRIGRCHRYGQKYDVVVINFINQRNETDIRVYELLDQKFHLFTGVFGASDDVIGTLESGVDIERQVLDIYQRCRTAEQIAEAFAKLQKRLDERIQTKIENTRRILMEQFDEDVHRRLKFNLENARFQVKRTEELFWKVTTHILKKRVKLYDTYSFYLHDPPLPEPPKGTRGSRIGGTCPCFGNYRGKCFPKSGNGFKTLECIRPGGAFSRWDLYSIGAVGARSGTP